MTFLRHSGFTLAGIRAGLLCLITVLAASSYADAADYVSVADNAAILYDAPSLKAKKLFVVSRYLPLEQVVNLNNWIKVRDSSGDMGWIEKRSLSNKRFVMVTAALAAIHQAAEEKSAVVIQAQQQIALEWLENTGSGWLKVRHLDGITGYIKTTEVWGN